LLAGSTVRCPAASRDQEAALTPTTRAMV